MPEQYSLTLAIIALLSAAVFIFGLVQLARMLRRKNEIIGELGYLSVLLISGGNLLNAIGKLLAATNGHNSAWLNNSLLFLSAPGFVCLAWALWQSNRNNSTALTAGSVWLLPLFFNGGLLALTAALKMVKGGQTWLKLLLFVTTVASIAAFVQLAQAALKFQKQLFAGMFILSLGMSLAMTFRGNDGTPVAEWAQQISSLISHAVFSFSAFKLSRLASGKM
jgi:hypothetical protein